MAPRPLPDNLLTPWEQWPLHLSFTWHLEAKEDPADSGPWAVLWAVLFLCSSSEKAWELLRWREGRAPAACGQLQPQPGGRAGLEGRTHQRLLFVLYDDQAQWVAGVAGANQAGRETVSLTTYLWQAFIQGPGMSHHWRCLNPTLRKTRLRGSTAPEHAIHGFKLSFFLTLKLITYTCDWAENNCKYREAAQQRFSSRLVSALCKAFQYSESSCPPCYNKLMDWQWKDPGQTR